jgi:Leucine-rich repeat (LRR) protein/tRNA A-37 threonylcarbamoyl transferase component Bud32
MKTFSHKRNHLTPFEMTEIPSTLSPIHTLSLLIISLAYLSITVNSQFSPPERTTLLNLRQRWNNPLPLQNWNSSTSPCDWPEVLCDAAGFVTALNLKDKNIIDPIPPFICDLKNLTKLDLSLNYIPGPFPTLLYNCSKLQKLDLSQNYFVGSIPDDIDRIPTLRYIDFGANNFTGDIPPAIGRLPELQVLYLYRNLFNGTYPSEIGNLLNLEILGMAYCDFLPAALPPEFGNLQKLTFLWMTETNLIGDVPATFSNMSSLERLDLSANDLSGPIPEGLFMLKNLSIVYMQNNRLSGSIPMVIESFNLKKLDLSTNNLTGRVPEDFGKLQELELLNLFSNNLSGQLPASIGLIPSLKEIRVFSNQLSGVLPPELGLHSKLEAFEVPDNLFIGNLPVNLCAGKTLFGLVAFSNHLTGEIPESLSSCDSLRTVQLFNNNFSGKVPSGLWTAQSLSSLMISNNSFSGELPSQLAWNMSRLEVSNNRFSGPIPNRMSSWMNLVVLKASNNQFSGKIPAELTSLPHLTNLMLDGNSISGQIPVEIISWKSLTVLNLARNNLSGPIPLVLCSLPDLLDLDLSENQLSGQIPPQLGHLKLTSLNLSSNKLTGRIPGEIDNMAYENSFLNNQNLCSETLIPYRCKSKRPKSNKISSKIMAMILVLATVVFVASVLITFYKLKDYKVKKHKRDIITWKLTSFQRSLHFTEANILSNLTESNMIGSGGSGKVYRISVGRNGECVAVKRIFNTSKMTATLEKEFLAEVQILGSIRHSNIVKLLCCISSQDSKLLVYEYMENQSLDRWLHEKKRSDRAPLDWPARIQIAIGAAHGLCYMHHDSSPPIIHRDVKSSNILLDKDFKSKIADFGLAKILERHGEANTMSSVAGSFGYLAPEYAYTTRINEKIDVFSFGVVLLELVTGREPYEPNTHINLAESVWKHFSDEKEMSDIIDDELKQECYMEEMITVLKLGLICTSTLPLNRPSMREILQMLRRCSPFDAYEGNRIGSEYDVTPLLDADSYLSSYKKRSKKVVDQKDDDSFRIVA